MEDYIYKALALNDECKVYVVRSTNIVNTAIAKHDLYPSAASVLGKAMTIGLMMGGTLKLDEEVTIKLDGNGPIGYVCVDANSHGNVRGYCQNPHVNFTRNDKIDDITTLGCNGYIDVIKDLKMENLFTSSIRINTGDLAKDFTYYFTKSEQTPSAILLSSLFDVDNTCKVCGGVLLQLLPNASEKTISYLEKKLSKITEFSQILNNTNELEDILKLLFENDYKLLDKYEATFFCPCSKSRFVNGLLTLSENELLDMANDTKDTEVTCRYCNTQYSFTPDEIKNIYNLKKENNK